MTCETYGTQTSGLYSIAWLLSNPLDRLVEMGYNAASNPLPAGRVWMLGHGAALEPPSLEEERVVDKSEGAPAMQCRERPPI
jgi:hypothetical protein